MQKFTIDRDDNVYLAFPDILLTSWGELICVYTQTTSHGDRTGSRVVMNRSLDRGATWAGRTVFAGEGDAAVEKGFYDCARVGALSDGRLYVLCSKCYGNERGLNDIHIWFSSDRGNSWPVFVKTGCCGIVPDKLVDLEDGTLLLSSHYYSPVTEKLEQYVWFSTDGGLTWGDRVTAAADPALNLCEISILKATRPAGGKPCLVGFMRENSGMGYDCKKVISEDGGRTWGPIVDFPLPGCHRPVSGRLADGRVMITYRFRQGGKGWLGKWTQNFFGAFTDVESIFVTVRNEAWTRIFPLDFDRSPVSDLGYSGWVQFPDGEILVVNYIVDDAPKAQIRGYRFFPEEFEFAVE